MIDADNGATVRQRVAEMRAEGLRCGERLTKGRTCCHASGHDGRHSHTWQLGDAKTYLIGSRVINLETGELLGKGADVAAPAARCRRPRNERLSPEAARRSLRGYAEKFAGEPAGVALPSDDYLGPWPYWCPHYERDMWLCDTCNLGIERPEDGAVGYADDTKQEGQRMNFTDASYHYSTGGRSYGVTTEGHDVRRDDGTGRVARIYSMSQKREALVLVREHGLSAVSRKLDIPRPTLKTWASRGIESD